jgi:acylaminoacyl-peptidase
MQTLRIALPAAVALILALSAAPAAASQAGSPAATADAPARRSGPHTASLRFTAADVFGLEWASDPQVSPDGRRIVYVRNGFDVMTDRARASLWIVDAEGGGHRALTTGVGDVRSPRWAPDGGRLVYVSSVDGAPQLRLRWMDTGQEAVLADLAEPPGGLAWSPDGARLAFTMFVPSQEAPVVLADLPTPPEGAEWAPPPRVVDEMVYRRDGGGWVDDGHTHLFVVPAEGGTPRQLTFGPYDHSGPAWTPDGRALVISSNRRDDREREANDTDLYRVALADGSATRLTERYGPDNGAVVSPDGRIAWTGFDDRYQGYQVTKLYVMEADGSGRRELTGGLDRDVAGPTWSADGRSVWFHYDDEGDTKVARVDLDGQVTVVAEGLGGLSLGRPYGGGSFSVGGDGVVAYTHTTPLRPADVAVVGRGRERRRVTGLNDDLLGHKELGRVEELWWESSVDGRPVQGWLATPPGFDPDEEYPLVLEIHGGPFANYGPRFAAEIQLYAAAGNLVLYTNPRGSTSYGEEFGNLIHHAYPGDDYFDLMSGVDAVVDRGIVDEGQLYVTGGSGGGVLTAWIVGKTDRFRAAVVQKPVINWASFVLHADGLPFFARYWFGRTPWEDPMHYWERSPLSLVGEVVTPTMLLTGEEDHRTPMSETEQYYGALRLRGVPTAMVRIPGAGHAITARPSNLARKAAYVLAWFEKYRDGPRRRRPTS